MEFWKSAGMHLLELDENNWLKVTADYLRAYLTRPEIHPVDESCDSEHRLFEKLMADPFMVVSEAEILKIKDKDSADNYRVFLSFRDHLKKHKTIEAAYFALFGDESILIPAMFIDQMVHLILRNILANETDPMILRAGELFYRTQIVTTGDEQLMLADREIVEMKTQSGFGGLGQLLAQSGTPMREISLDILSDENSQEYWARSDNFDMAIDFRFTQPASDALGRVMEAWIKHFMGVKTQITALKSIRDERWSWHIGCDEESNRILNALYDGKTLDQDDIYAILALYRLEFLNSADALDTLMGKAVYIGIAMNKDGKLKFKPQNLLKNLPVKRN